MTYKILELKRYDTKNSLWSFVMEEQEIDNTTILVEYSTTDLDELETKIIEILKINGSSKLRVVTDVSYDVDITFPTI